MPHITLECTSNIEMDFNSFFTELSSELAATGHAKQMGIKCRKVTSEIFHIIDGNPEYKMVNLLIRLREGRPIEVRKNFSQIAMALLEKHLAKDVEAKTIILSTEVKELIKGLDLTKNAVR